ncbi:MAG TPA: DUF1688 domain-containing protein [Cyanobacteria bacterium UBA11049]|nr:DUF1688 domain-containing protein [Cyanobacteria bacterium UBA11049]
MNSKNIQHSGFSIQHSEIAYLRSAGAIRDRCGVLFELGCEDKLSHFRCDLTQLERVADYVIEVMREEYPDLEIPFHSRWRHFEAGDVPRLAELDEMLVGVSAVDKTRAKFDLAIISVLLDAGAGNSWRYYEQESDRALGRSEGLAVASFCLFCQGYLSTNEEWLLQADAQGLQGITEALLSSRFQVSPDNPLVGLAGRVELLQKLGKTLLSKPHIFGSDNPRPGNLVNYLLEQFHNGQLSAQTVLSAVLEGLGDIWPGRIKIAGVNLGNVWHHPTLQKFKTKDTAPIHHSSYPFGEASYIIHHSLVPFHKLSQWLTYSLLEPLQELGLEITELNALTGLPEYRNGGLCINTVQLRNIAEAVLNKNTKSNLGVRLTALPNSSFITN